MRSLARLLSALAFLLFAPLGANAAFLCDNAWMTTATTGTGTITLGSAVASAQTFAACGITNGQTVRYRIFDSTAWEVGSGTYTSAGTTLSRTPTASSNAGSAINLSGSATVVITALTADLPSESTPTDGTVSTSAHLFALESGVLSRYSVSNFIAAIDGAGLSVDANGLLVPSIATSTKTGAYTVVAADRGSVVAIGTNSVTLTLTAAATLGNGFWFIAANDNVLGSTNTLTVDPNASETIDGVTTSTDYSGASRLIYTDGSNWFSRILAGGYVAFTANGNFIVPNGAKQIVTDAFGGGGGGGAGQSGATATARTGGTGGGGGSRPGPTARPASAYGTNGATLAVVVGTAGTAGTGSSGASGGNGGAGGSTSLAGITLAAGGGGGAGGAGAARGGGTGAGGPYPGNTAPTAASAGGANASTNVTGVGISGGGSTTNVNTNPMSGQYGGGAGGGTLTAGGAGGRGGTSLYAGGGGGGGAGITTGNAAAAGGAGGAGATFLTAGGSGGAGGNNTGTSGTAGAAGANDFGGSGGGGGGTNGTSTCGAGGAGGAPSGGGGGGAACLTGTAGGSGGAGARGELRIWYSELTPANDNLPADEAMAA